MSDVGTKKPNFFYFILLFLVLLYAKPKLFLASLLSAFVIKDKLDGFTFKDDTQDIVGCTNA
jgi:uncharacterized membrane protein YraQ (UPF0718 family)